MKDEAPVRRHVNISASSDAQLELRLHWFAGALAIRGGYILATVRRANGTGRHMATVAYEMPLPRFAPSRRGSSAPERARGSDWQYDAAGEWPARQEQGSSSGVV